MLAISNNEKINLVIFSTSLVKVVLSKMIMNLKEDAH